MVAIDTLKLFVYIVVLCKDDNLLFKYSCLRTSYVSSRLRNNIDIKSNLTLNQWVQSKDIKIYKNENINKNNIKRYIIFCLL